MATTFASSMCWFLGPFRSEDRRVHPLAALTDLHQDAHAEGMKVAKAKGRLRGKQPKLKPNQAKHLVELHDSGHYTQAELAELFGVGAIHGVPDHRANAAQTLEPERPFVQIAGSG